MLKTKLVKAGFFGHGALFMIVAPYNVHLNKAEGFAEQHLSHTTTTTIAIKDTVDQAALTAALAQKTALQAPTFQWNKAATSYSRTFIKKNEEDLVAVQKRSASYFNIIEPIFKRYGLPLELKYLAVIESELKANAVSHAGAKGPWQLMSGTGREFGLKIGGKTDERTHYTKSTIAAAKYLKSLHNEFDDWLLVIAAYNGGSGTVFKAIKKAGTRNFWRLQGFLPAETRSHVKRFIGTHYYFQSEGSETVLTRAETREYHKELIHYRLEQQKVDSLLATVR